LAAAGEHGISRALSIVFSEINHTLALLGATDIGKLSGDMLQFSARQ